MKITSTSRHHAICEDIELRKTETTRIIFRPELVDNAKNEEAPVRGNFIIQKKRISGDWEEYKTTSLATMKDGDGIKLLLHAEEVLKLLKGLEGYKKIYEEHGIQFGESHFTLTSKNVADVLEQLSDYKDLPALIEKLEKLKINSLQALDSIVGVSGLNKVYEKWEKEKNNPSEDYWHDLFKEYPWILSQIFPYKVTILGDKVYVGGKGLDNKGGGVIDFLFKKDLLDNVVFIEIKNPRTSLLGQKYRNNSYSISPDLTGSINQLLGYKETFFKEYSNLNNNSDEHFGVFNPRTIIIAGSFENEKMDINQRKSFELFRNDLKNVEIITFDELFTKVKHLIDLIGGKA